jgi:hypothetical protein
MSKASEGLGFYHRTSRKSLVSRALEGILSPARLPFRHSRGVLFVLVRAV